MSDLYHVSSSPHVRSKDTTSKIMLYVIMALLPTSLFGIYNFGIRALILILVTIASCVASEWIFNKIVHKKNSIDDLSAVVTGLLLALNLPASLPWWEAVIGGVFAIVIVKMMFGGLGQNFMNPALGARCFLLIAFAADMTNFTAWVMNEGISSSIESTRMICTDDKRVRRSSSEKSNSRVGASKPIKGLSIINTRGAVRRVLVS